MPLDVMTPEVMTAQVKHALRRGERRQAVFTLIVGAGFSHGVVPMTGEMMRAEIGVWMAGEDLGLPPARKRGLAAAFWRAFNDDNARLGTGCRVEVDPEGLPLDATAAYQTLCRKQAARGIATVEQARAFLRAMVGPSTNHLNGAHFFLAALLDAQRRGELAGVRPFCRTIFTTNFDPLLQVALQLMGVLYYMTDRPELTIDPGHMLEDDEAVHLVYAHGSIHRPYLANDADALADLKKANAGVFRSYLEDHGVIVVGYSGWDDSLMAALEGCTNFANNLYWCDIFPAADAPTALSSFARDLLARRGGRFYVPLGAGGADALMGLFFQELVKDQGIPRLLTDPFTGVAEQLGRLSLQGLTLKRDWSGATNAASGPSTHPADPLEVSADQLRADAVSALEQARDARRTGEAFVDAAGEARYLLSVALDRAYAGRFDEAQAFWTRVIELAGAPVDLVARALTNRGVTWGQQGDREKELAAYTQVVELPGAPAKHVGQALFFRAITHEQQGELDQAEADYTRAIELAGALTEDVAQALVNRGVYWGNRGDTEKELADYARAIDLPGAPVEQVAKALCNRGAALGQQGDWESAAADFTRVVELSGAPVSQVARALFGRGVSWAERNDAGKAEADYTRVVDLAGAPVEQAAQALFNRGAIQERREDWENAAADYARVIDLPGAPTAMVARALVARGSTWVWRGDKARAEADFSRVIEMTGAPAEHVAQALLNRGVVRARQGELERAVDDYTRVLTLADAPVEQVAHAFADRGWASYLAGKYGAFLEDTRAALAHQPGLAYVNFNLGLALLACGHDAEALAAYRSAGERFSDRIDTAALPDLEEAEKAWLAGERARPVIALLRALRK